MANTISPKCHAEITLRYVQQRTDRVILFYSGGKDSIVCLHMAAKMFKEVHAVFMYFIDNLEHQQKLLDYPKKYKNVTVHKFPHWMLSHYYRNAYMQFDSAKNETVPLLKLTDIESSARRRTGASWIINGAKQSDSLNRRLMLGTLKFNSINEPSKRVYPLAIWKKRDVLSYIKLNQLIRPVEYSNAKSNGVDLDEQTLVFLREKYPDDLKKLLKQFPLAEKILFDHDNRNKTYKVSKIRGKKNPSKSDKRSKIQPKSD